MSTGITSVHGANIGSGLGLYTGTEGSSQITLDFKTLLAGPGLKLTADQQTITINLDTASARLSFLQLTEAPSRITPAGMLYGTPDGKLAFTATPTTAGSLLTFNGMGFDWVAPATPFTGIDASGDNAILISGAVTQGNGGNGNGNGVRAKLAFSLSNTGVTAGSYTAASLSVDAQGRITGIVSTPVGETNDGTNLGSGTKVYAGKSGKSLQFKSIQGAGTVSVQDDGSTITLSSNAVTAVGLVAGDGITVSGSTITQSGSFQVALSNTGVTPGTYNSVTVDGHGRVVAAAYIAPVAPQQTTAQNVGVGSGIFASQTGTTLNLKSIAGAGIISVTPSATNLVISANAVTSVGLDAGQGIAVTGPSTVTDFGRFGIALTNTGVAAGTYTLPTLTVDAMGRITAVASTVAQTSTGTNLGSSNAIYAGTQGSALQFRTITAGQNVQIQQNAGDLVINAVVPTQQLLGTTPTGGTPNPTSTLQFGTGLNYSVQGNIATVTAAPVAPTLAISDQGGNTVTQISSLALSGLTIGLINGVATLIAPPAPTPVIPTFANATVTDGANTVTNPTSIQFQGAYVTQSGTTALVTIPQASAPTSNGTAASLSLTVSSGTYGNQPVANVSEIRFADAAITSDGGTVTVTQGPKLAVGHGNAVIDATGVGALFFQGANITTDTNGTYVSFPGVSDADVVTLDTDQTVGGRKTFANALVAASDFTVSGYTTLTKMVAAQNGLTVSGGVITDQLTASNPLTVQSGIGGPITALVANGATARGSLAYNQDLNQWNFGTAALSGNLYGNANTATAATRLATPFTVQLQGDVTGASMIPFDGSTGTLTISTALPAQPVTPGAYTNANVTVDQQGRVVAIANGAASAITNIGSGIVLTNPAANATYVKSLAVNTANALSISENNGTITIDLDTTNFAKGTVTSVNVGAGAGITVIGEGPVSTSGSFTVGLANTTVQPGTYSNPTIQVDQYGRITMASAGNATAAATTVTNLGADSDGYLFAQTGTNGDLQFRSLVAGQNVSITETGTTITISANAASQVDTGPATISVTDGTNSLDSQTILFQGATLSFSGNTATVSVPTGTVQSVNARSSDNSVLVSGGPVTSTGTFDLTLPTTGVSAGTYNYATITVDAQGRVTAASENVAPTGTAGGTVTSVAVASPTGDLIVTGSPITTSGTINLALSNAVVKADSNGNFTANTITANLTGTATQATKLTTAHAIALSQDVTGTATFDGSQDISIAASLAPTGVTPGTYSLASVTVDAKGRVTTIANGTVNVPAPTLRHSDFVTVTDVNAKTYSFTIGGQALSLNSNFLMVYFNRDLMRPSEYTVTGNSVTVNVTLTTGDELEVVTTA